MIFLIITTWLSGYLLTNIDITSFTLFLRFKCKLRQSLHILFIQWYLWWLFWIRQIKRYNTFIWIIHQYFAWSLVRLVLIDELCVGCNWLSSKILGISFILFDYMFICFGKWIKMLICIFDSIIQDTWCIWKLFSQCYIFWYLFLLF